MADRYVYRLVVDALPEWPAAECWRCGWPEPEDWPEEWAENAAADPGYLLCEECGLSMAPAKIVGSRRNYLSKSAAHRHAGRVQGMGGHAHVERSEPVRWPDHG